MLNADGSTFNRTTMELKLGVGVVREFIESAF